MNSSKSFKLKEEILFHYNNLTFWIYFKDADLMPISTKFLISGQ